MGRPVAEPEAFLYVISCTRGRVPRARWLLGRKVAGQAHLLARRLGDRETAETIADLVGAIEQAEMIEAARQLEASAAALYFGAWSGRPATTPRFAAQDRKRVPPHWAVFETRRSVLASANSNRKAERPVNVLLNYCFGLLEAEAVFACQAVGLDPGLGIVHSDARGRQSMALDLIEPVRPEVESYVLHLIERRTFRKVEFIESPEGHVRLRTPLTHELAEQMPNWARSLAPVAEHVAHVLGAARSGRYVATTPLTRRSGKAAQAAVKARKTVAQDTASSRTARQRPVTGQAPLPWNCPDCGAAVTNTQHVRCDACIAADSSQSPETRGRRGRAIAARRRIAVEWDAAHGEELVRPRPLRARHLAGAGRCEARRHHGGHGMVEELRLPGACRSVGAARLDVEGTRRVSRVPDATTPLCRHGALVHKGARRGQFTTAWSARNPLTGLNS